MKNTLFKEHLNTVSAVLGLVPENNIQKIVKLLRSTRARGGTIFVAGNGGSAATASHFANDLVKMGGVRAISLPDATPTILAYGNDNGWGFMFWDD